jgi:glycosyltransferase involved in cell wall biosynthesis
MRRTYIIGPELATRGGVSNYWTKVMPNLDAVYFELLTSNTSCWHSQVKSLLNLCMKLTTLPNSSEVNVVLNFSSQRSSLFKTLLLQLFLPSDLNCILFNRGWRDKASLSVVERILSAEILNRSCKLIVLSNSAKDDFSSSFLYDKPLYVETTVFQSDGKFNSSFNKKKLLFASRLEDNKGVKLMVESFVSLKMYSSGYSLAIAGDGSLSNYVEKISSEYQGISYLGQLKQPDLYQLMDESGVFIFPSTHDEGMPNACVEAMAHCNIILGFNIGGLIDFHENSSVGFITSIFTKNAWYDVLLKLMEQDDEVLWSIAQNNQNVAFNKMSDKSVAERLKVIFHE